MFQDVDVIYISEGHADSVGCTESFAFARQLLPTFLLHNFRHIIVFRPISVQYRSKLGDTQLTQWLFGTNQQDP